jgi:hypothetical protein
LFFVVKLFTRQRPYFDECSAFLERTAKIQLLALLPNFFPVFWVSFRVCSAALSRLLRRRLLYFFTPSAKSFSESYADPAAVAATVSTASAVIAATVIFKSGGKDKQFHFPAKYFLIWFIPIA